jgi:hypothetical protein
MENANEEFILQQLTLAPATLPNLAQVARERGLSGEKVRTTALNMIRVGRLSLDREMRACLPVDMGAGLE